MPTVRAFRFISVLSVMMACSAVPAATQTEAQGTTIDMRLSDARVETGTPVRVSGRVSRSYAGRQALLQFRPAGTAAWETVAQATVDRRGNYRVGRALPRSGAVRVVIPPPAGTATAASGR